MQRTMNINSISFIKHFYDVECIESNYSNSSPLNNEKVEKIIVIISIVNVYFTHIQILPTLSIRV